jgi:hypothetical protein
VEVELPKLAPTTEEAGVKPVPILRA